MKTKIILLQVALFLATNTFSQIKIYTGGSISFGSTTAPPTGEKHRFTGNVVISSSGSGTASSIYLRGNNAFSGTSNPDYTWLGNDQTGFFHPASNIIGITIGNSEKFRFNSSGQILNANSSSSASTPDYSWNSNSNTGMFRYGSDIIGFSTGGSERFRINSNGQLLKKGGPNSASTPDFSWENDPNTGIFWKSADIMGFSSNGAERMQINNAGNVLIGTTTQSNGERAVITGASNQQPISIYTSHSTDGGYGEIIWVNQHHTKAFSVISSATGSNVEKFFIHGNGDVWGNTATWVSDKNLKENIDSISGALNKIKQLKGVSYNFKASYIGAVDATRKEIGFIAQDVEKILPEVVRTNDNGLKGIVYNSLIPLLIEAIKEQDKQITQLQSDVNTCCNSNQNRIINPLNNNGSDKGTINTGSYIKQNSPNPFSKETLIDFFIAEKNANSSILLFDMNGKLLKTLPLNVAGKGSVTISGNDFQPGMYYYSLIINDKEIDTKKMILTQ